MRKLYGSKRREGRAWRKLYNEIFIGETSGSHGDEYEDGCLLGCFAV
jgi:hypothetical protein